MGKVHAVCISTIRGVAKQAVPEGNFIVNWGIEGDAHAEHWHRQVSLLGLESIEAFRRRQGLGQGFQAAGPLRQAAQIPAQAGPVDAHALFEQGIGICPASGPVARAVHGKDDGRKTGRQTTG